MIVPTNKLLWWSGAVLVPIAVVAAFIKTSEGLAACLASGFVGLVLIDAWRGSSLLRLITVVSPKPVSLVARRPATFQLVFTNPTRKKKQLRLGIPFPLSWSVEDIETLLILPEGKDQSEISLSCMPGKRGRYQVTAAVLEELSSFAFWAVRRSLPVEIEFQVYPDLREEQRHYATLFLKSGRMGRHALRQVGKGREFEKLRDYLPGDPLEDIHWKATARRGRPISKVFQIERTQEIYMVIDHSRLMSRVAVTAYKERDQVTFLDQAIASSLILAGAAEEHGDRFGLIAFSAQVTTFLRAGNGSRHFQHCRNALYTLKSEPLTPDYAELLTSLRLKLSRRALLILFTSLDDPILSETFLEHVSILSRKHLVIVLMIRPAGVAPLFTGEAPLETEGIYDRLSGHLLWQRLRKLGLELQQKGVRFEMVSREELTAEAVSQYMRIKQKQIL